MKILHTADWHIGRNLYGRKRYQEFGQFLDWLPEAIEREQVEVLLIAGDVFDSTSPSNKALELYYNFLCRVAASATCRHVVVIGGNHDSPSLLEAPKNLLRALNVYVVGASSGSVADEVQLLESDSGSLLVCAVPYLRDRDLRSVEASESWESKDLKLLQGIRAHYQQVCARALELRAQHPDKQIPIVALGHLFASGGRTIDGDGVRELYVGSLARVGADAFPPEIDYLALGHLHSAQSLGDNEHMRYSGSPLPMGYGEANQTKQVLLVEFSGLDCSVRALDVPCFQELERISGGLQQILNRIEELKQQQSSTWLEVDYSASELQPNLRELLDEALAGSNMELLRVRNQSALAYHIPTPRPEDGLDQLSPTQVFERCLASREVAPADSEQLLACYQEILQELQDSDSKAH